MFFKQAVHKFSLMMVQVTPKHVAETQQMYVMNKCRAFV